MFTALGKRIPLILLLVIAMSGVSFAAHPLITDDTGTQGKGNAQLEFIGEYGYDREEGETTRTFELPTIPVFSYGVRDTVDVVLGVPYQYIRTSIAFTYLENFRLFSCSQKPKGHHTATS